MKSRAQVKKATPRRQKKPIFILVLIAIIGIPVWQVWVRKGSKVGAAARAVEAKTDEQQKRDDALVSALVLLVLAGSCRALEQDVDASSAGAPAATPSDAVAEEGNQGFLYGRVTTDDGAAYVGRMRFGRNEEAVWGD